jgi:hypothetical protein
MDTRVERKNGFFSFSHFSLLYNKEKNDKNDKYRNLVIPIVLTNNFHIEYSTKTDGKFYNSHFSLFSTHTCGKKKSHAHVKRTSYVETQNFASPGKTDSVAYRETQNFASLQAKRKTTDSS